MKSIGRHNSCPYYLFPLCTGCTAVPYGTPWYFPVVSNAMAWVPGVPRLGSMGFPMVPRVPGFFASRSNPFN